MLKPYYLDELRQLKELGAEFAKAHPALAPMLSGPMADPDVERLLEGVAFQTAILRQKLDDDFPEIVHDLMHLIWPHYLRPIPATTTVAFTSKASLKQSQAIPAGVQLAALPVDGTVCEFRTVYPVELHPLVLLNAAFEQPAGQAPEFRLSFALNGLPLSQWQPRSVRLFLAGDYPTASDLYLLLRRNLRRIVITPTDGGNPAVLSPDALRPLGFADGEGLLPYPSHAFPGYRLLQEYFTAPDKFLYFDLTGWERWSERGNGTGFTVSLELDAPPFVPARVTKENFVLFATPVVNIFCHDADPILLDHRATQYLVRPAGSDPSHYQVYSVNRVTGFVRGTAQERLYAPFNLFRPGSDSAPVFHTFLRMSQVRTGFDVYLTVSYPKGGLVPEAETLGVELTCTNGALPENLRIGDVCRPTARSPEFAEFRNITPITPGLLPPLESGMLWRLTSHLSLNYLSLANIDNLRSLLELYLFPDSRASIAVMANQKRLAGLEEVEALPHDRLVGGVMMRGREIRLKLRQDHFAGPGDMYLFGCMLDQFLGGYASINTFTRLIMTETLRGRSYEWPARLGKHQLV